MYGLSQQKTGMAGAVRQLIIIQLLRPIFSIRITAVA